MDAIAITAFGPPEALRPTQRPQPVPADGEVLIRVHAAGLNRPDILQRRGLYPPPPGVTDIPGLEVAGEIVQSRDPAFSRGRKVCALLAGGGYAAYACAPGGQCLALPDGFDMTAAAALPEALFTLQAALFDAGGLAAGQTALIHGGASGIGTTAIQMARVAGACAVVTVGTPEKAALCRTLGADRAILYKTEDFVALLEPDSVDVVLDMVGGSYVARNMAVLKPGGRHVSIAFMGGAKAEIDVPALMRKRLILTGSTLRPRPAAEKTVLRDAVRTRFWPAVETGAIRPVIAATFPLEQAAAAHALLESGETAGKIVLRVV